MGSDEVVMYGLEEDKQELQKQLGCMNGFFQLFDRRYLLGQRRHGHHHNKMLPPGQTHNSKDFNNASEKPKEKMQNNVVKEKHRVSVESSRNSFSSSCSSLDCSKRVQTESSSFCPSIVSEPSSPASSKKHESWASSIDIRDVVKDSMTRKPRVVSVKTVAKGERKGPAMTHVDSPRPLQLNTKPVPSERKDQNLDNLQELSVLTSSGVKVKDASRYSYDGRESPYKAKSISSIKDRPRLSLDSKQSSARSRALLANAVDQSQSHEPGSNKRLPSSVVARLMGLDVIKIKPCSDEESNSGSRLSSKQGSPRVSNALTRIPLEPAPWKQEVKVKARVKQPVNKKALDGYQSVYGQIEKRLTEVEFNTSGKDLRALKQILEAIQRTKMKLENTRPIEPAAAQKSVNKPASVSVVITDLQKVKKINPSRGPARNRKPTETKSTGRTKKPEFKDHGDSRNPGPVSPRLQKAKIKKQSNAKLTVTSSKTEDQLCNNNCDKPMTEQPSPVSVLDAFYTEDAPSPVKKISYAFQDDDDLFDEREWTQVGLDNLVSTVEFNPLGSGFIDIKHEHINQLVHLTESQQDIDEDHIYIKEILLASGLLKNLDRATTIAHFNPTGCLINPELFHVLEKTKARGSKPKRKLIFDTVNAIVARKLARGSGSSGLWASKRKGGVLVLNEEQLLQDLCLEIHTIQTNKASDEYDDIIHIISEDLNHKSEDWDDKGEEISAIALDVERLIFKDLIGEIVSAEVSGAEEKRETHRRQLFLL